jgi:TadE-like protein
MAAGWRRATLGRRRGAGRGDRGSSAVELVLLAPMLLALIWLIIQYALYYQGRQVVAAPGGVSQVRVTVTGRAASIMFGLTLTIRETAGGPVECFRPGLNGGQQS